MRCTYQSRLRVCNTLISVRYQGSDGRDIDLSGLAAIRSRKSTWGRRVLSTYIVAWFAIILQPCAVAGELDHDCPHCPPEISHETHHQQVKSDSNCEIGDRQNLESRSLKINPKDSTNMAAVAIVHESYTFDARNSGGQQLEDPSGFLVPSGPPLNVLHCVYLK